MPPRKITPLLFKKIYGKLPNDNEWRQFEKNYGICVMSDVCMPVKKKLNLKERKEKFMGRYKGFESQK